MSKKLRILVGQTALVALILAPALHGTQGESVLKWHTYAGSSMNDDGAGIAVDSSGNIYLAGWSDATWGNPINPHSGGRDAFVAKLNSAGELEWNTFVGSSSPPPYQAGAIAVDGSGNIYVVGTSDAQWSGEPFPGGGSNASVAKLNSNGELQWHRFMTTYGDQVGTAVAVDAIGNVYVGGWGGWVWDTPPVEPFPDAGAAFVAKLDSSGAEVWHAFLGSGVLGDFERCRALAVDVGGNVYVAGWGTMTWGTPINDHAGDNDAFVAKLNSSGFRQWNTFMGSSGVDFGSGIALDGSGNVYVSGDSEATWGTPVNPHGGGGSHAFAAKLDSSGVRQWHTFMGGTYGWDIAVDGGQNVYVTGVWGAAHPGFVAVLNRDGVLQWNTFLEAILENIALDRSRNVYVAGEIDYSWGTPVNPWAGGWDAFVAKIGSTIEINIDIKPGSFPNSINLRSRGVIPVAILTTPTFDATTVDPLSVRFGRHEAQETHGTGHIEDVDADGDLDMVLHFRTAETGFQCGDTSATLTGETLDGLDIEGQDSVHTVDCK